MYSMVTQRGRIPSVTIPAGPFALCQKQQPNYFTLGKNCRDYPKSFFVLFISFLSGYRFASPIHQLSP